MLTNMSVAIRRVDDLAKNFEQALDVFDSSRPFRKPGQLEWHVRTMDLRLAIGSAKDAARDAEFQCSLYETLKAWGIGQRASRLVSVAEFQQRISEQANALEAFEKVAIDSPTLDVDTIAGSLWQLIDQLKIVENDAPVVAGTKALHHLLPELVVPVDRRFTQAFFGWANPVFQYGQREAFLYAFRAFGYLSRAANVRRYLSGGWHTSCTKVIDNGLVGYCILRGLVNGVWGNP